MLHTQPCLSSAEEFWLWCCWAGGAAGTGPGAVGVWVIPYQELVTPKGGVMENVESWHAGSKTCLTRNNLGLLEVDHWQVSLTLGGQRIRAL